MFPRSKAAPMDWERDTQVTPSPLWTPRSAVQYSAGAAASGPGASAPFPGGGPYQAPSAPGVADSSMPDVDMLDQSALSLNTAEGANDAIGSVSGDSAVHAPQHGSSADGQEKPRVFEKNHLFQAPRTRKVVQRVRGLRQRRSQRSLVAPGARRSGEPEEEQDDSSGDEDGERDGDKSADLSISRAAGSAMNYFLFPPAPPPVPTQVLSHLDWPEVFLGYAQFIFNALVLVGILYVGYSVLATITIDVRERVEETTLGAIHDVKECSALWRENRCGGADEVRHLWSACRDWERCMARNPSVVGRSTVAASLLADTLNQFVDRLSWKTTAFIVALFGLAVRAANSFFAYFRFQSAQRRSERVKEYECRSARPEPIHDASRQRYHAIPDAAHPSSRSRPNRRTRAVPWRALPDESNDLSADTTTT